jgi:catechol 2,3-dioxygenase-like lactoylglutathione lyase family enzyme
MKRFHVHVSVSDLGESVRFYSELFGAEPTEHKPDYAKWMLEDPRVNFAISTRGQRIGVNHLGFQVDSDPELRGMKTRLVAADGKMIQEDAQSCCYARSDKYWVTDPTGIAWETFHTLDSIPVYGEDTASTTVLRASGESGAVKGACCIPAASANAKLAPSRCCVPDESAA